MTTYNKNASHSFAFLPRIEHKRNVFNRSHGYKTTMDAGYLYPVLIDEVLPGDTVTLQKANVFSRIMTLITPVMDNIYCEMFAYFVPQRLVWEHSKEFFGEQLNPDDTTDYIIPTVKTPDEGYPIGSLADYFGLPVNKKIENVSALPFRVYNLCYDEWHRDENLQARPPINRGDGPDNADDYQLKRRGKRHDYFTSCLPAPQKGDPVMISLGTSAPVIGNGYNLALTDGTRLGGLATSDYSTVGFNLKGYGQSIGNYTGGNDWGAVGAGTLGVPTSSQLGNNLSNSGLIADLSQATASTVNDLRKCIQVQAFQELDMRGGTRYTEKIQAHFGVTSPDARLQRPELLAVSSAMLNVNTVPQTSSTDNQSPQGNLSAYGTLFNDTLSFSKSFTEHGYIIILANFRADLTYQQGIDRMWTRKTQYDYFWPILSNLGEQAVYNKEIYADGSLNDNGVFGYQERYAEYRYFPSKITGKLRSDDPQSLDVWHLSQYFTSCPSLNAEFIEDNPPIERIIAVQDEPQFLVDIQFDYVCARPIPLFGIPASLGVHL